MSMTISNETNMSDATARSVVIPFPARPLPPDVRLARAVACLNAATKQQREAVAKWRESLEALRATTKGLETSLHTYNGSLDRLGSGVAALRLQAEALQRWAEDAETREG